ncbi:MAG: hypothetical protein LBQ10_12090 [Desulfovibrio sp.]|jgi:hypothetical protein|nr:hypothetical protein [Desulfovibrio sp.]
MKYEHFESVMEKIYGTFGRKIPEGIVIADVWDRVKSLPDAFMDFAHEKLRDEEKLPGNMGLALQRLWPEYLDKNPGIRSAHKDNEGCDNCRGLPGSLPGMFFVYGPDGHRYAVKCVCSRNASLAHWPAWTRSLALERGYLLHDPNTPPEEAVACPAPAPALLSFMGT